MLKTYLDDVMDIPKQELAMDVIIDLKLLLKPAYPLLQSSVG